MNKSFKNAAFILKSMLWSLLLYFILMLAFNWDDVSTHMRGNKAITTATGNQTYHQAPDANTNTADPLPVKISGQVTMFSNIYQVVRAVSGL